MRVAKSHYIGREPNTAHIHFQTLTVTQCTDDKDKTQPDLDETIPLFSTPEREDSDKTDLDETFKI